jgi:prevent-host-death family protein
VNVRTIGAFEAKTHLAQLLDEVASGERITITRHGVPVALLVPAEGDARPDVEDLIRGWRSYQEANDVTLGPGLTIRDLIEDGRRF